MIRLVGIDVDGTLVGKSGEVSPKVWEAAERARAAGIRLALCSGRPAFGISVEYARRLQPQGWHCFQNGASIVHLPDGESRSAALPADWVARLVAQSRAGLGGPLQGALELYTDREYVTETDSPWAREHADLLDVEFQCGSFDSLRGPVVRAQWLLSSAQAEQVMAIPHVGVEIAQSTSPLMPETQFVGITHEGVSKGSAMRAVADAYGIRLEDVMYVGDAGNDLPALRVVGHPVAMANASPLVLQTAAHHVGHVDDGGLAQALNLAIAST